MLCGVKSNRSLARAQSAYCALVDSVGDSYDNAVAETMAAVANNFAEVRPNYTIGRSGGMMFSGNQFQFRVFDGLEATTGAAAVDHLGL